MSQPSQRLVTVTNNMHSTPASALPSPSAASSSASTTKRSVGAYIVTKRLGNGSFATVWRGYHRHTLQPVAIKSISLAKLASNRKHVANLESEIECMRALQHENVVRLIETHDSERHKYLIMEFCEGGDLSHYLRKHKQPLPLPLAQRFAIQLRRGLEVLHSRQLIHRDLKPQNLLLDQSHSPYTAVLKLADFGFARSLLADDMAATLCGSPLYMAPEILKYQAYDAKVDLWSVGAILYEMVVGRVPYTGQNHIQLLDRIEREEVSWPAAVEVSAECRQLIERLLKRRVEERMSFQEFFAHPFLQEKGAVQRNNRPGPEEQSSAQAAAAEAAVAGAGGRADAAPVSMHVSSTLYDKSAHASTRNNQQATAAPVTIPASTRPAYSPLLSGAATELQQGEADEADAQHADSPERSRIVMNASPPVDIPQSSPSQRDVYGTSPLILPPSSSPPLVSSPFFSSSPPSPSPLLAASSTGRRPSSSLSLRKDSGGGSMAGSGSGSGTERNKASGSIDKEYEMVDQVPQTLPPDSPSAAAPFPVALPHTSPSLLSTFVSASQRLVAHVVSPVFVSLPASPSSAAPTPAKFSPSLHSIADVPYKCVESDDELGGVTLAQLSAAMRRLKEDIRKANAVAKAARFSRDQAKAGEVAGGFKERVVGVANGGNTSLIACAVGLWVRALSALHACMDEMEAFYEQLLSVQAALPHPLSEDARDLEEQWHDSQQTNTPQHPTGLSLRLTALLLRALMLLLPPCSSVFRVWPAARCHLCVQRRGAADGGRAGRRTRQAEAQHHHLRDRRAESSHRNRTARLFSLLLRLLVTRLLAVLSARSLRARHLYHSRRPHRSWQLQRQRRVRGLPRCAVAVRAGVVRRGADAGGRRRLARQRAPVRAEPLARLASARPRQRRQP